MRLEAGKFREKEVLLETISRWDLRIFTPRTCRADRITRWMRKACFLPDFTAYALGGSLKGQLTMKYEGLQFRAVTKLQNVRLSEVTPAIDHAGFPIDSLHWDSVISADTVETWHDNFRDFDVAATLQLEEPDDLRAGHIPVTGDWKIRYRDNRNLLEISAAGFRNADLARDNHGSAGTERYGIGCSSGRWARWKTGAISFTRSLEINLGARKRKIRYIGSLQWDGTITGASDGPTFTGHFRGENFRYAIVALDSLDGDMIYSPKALIDHARASDARNDAGGNRRGTATE